MHRFILRRIIRLQRHPSVKFARSAPSAKKHRGISKRDATDLRVGDD
jgi:hypothetical protein